MDIKTPLGILRWLLIVGLLSWGAIQCLAQTKAAQPTKPPAQLPTAAQTAPDKVWFKDPNSIMPMRKMTNAERRAAAERNKARREKADAQRRQKATTNTQGGVQQ
jgi:hypothetical protein